MRPEERIAEIAAVLAVAFVRLSARQGGPGLISPLNSATCALVNSAESPESRDVGYRRQRKEISA